jgi:hypothetical protein
VNKVSGFRFQVSGFRFQVSGFKNVPVASASPLKNLQINEKFTGGNLLVF